MATCQMRKGYHNVLHSLFQKGGEFFFFFFLKKTIENGGSFMC